MTTIGLLHPGEMGAGVGAAARAGGSRVLWASEGRGDDTRRRAAAAGLEDAEHGGRARGQERRGAGRLSPARRARRRPCGRRSRLSRAVRRRQRRGADHLAAIAKIVEAAGATYVDGGIIGPPPDKPGTTRLYLSGAAAERVRALFAPGPLEAVVLPGDLTSASAIKMAYAAWTKGSQALIMAVRALATAEGVDEALLAEWSRSQPDLPKRSENAAKGTARKAWRWVGEMDEIAATFKGAGLPDGFHRGAGEVYRRMASYKDAPTPPSMEDVAKTLLKEPGA